MNLYISFSMRVKSVIFLLCMRQRMWV